MKDILNNILNFLNNILSGIKKFIINLWNNHKKDIIELLIIILLLILCIISVKSCSNNKEESDRSKYNIEVLCDSIEYYKCKNGEMAAEKTLLCSDIDLLKTVNQELNDQLKNMKVKNAEQALLIKGYIENPQQDTIWHIDTLYNCETIYNKFDFSNEYRTLNGTVYYNEKQLGLSINEDKVFVDYTIAIKDNTVYVKSDNPYVQFSDISGITIPEKKKQHWGWGLNLSVGPQYGFINGKFDIGVQLGFGVNYNF